MSAADTTLREPRRFAIDLLTVAGALLLAAGAILVAGGQSEASVVVVALIASGGLLLLRRVGGLTVAGLVLPYLALPGLFGIIRATAGAVPISVWLALAACWFAAIAGVSYLSAMRGLSRTNGRIRDLAVAALFGLWLMILWEALIIGFKVPFILLPPPSAVWLKLMNSIPTLAADFRQTFLKAVLTGYAIGCTSGFLVAIVADRVGFLKRGLLPVGNLVSALPIIGVAPIMVMWFGFDWQSKAAVVVIMTFFPMLVNTLAGLSASEAMERDLMHTYAANYWQSLIKLRLPAALPFIFNALKINSTLAMIGAIVAEFFGTPVVGMGFRISTEVGRMNIDMVWAEIAVAALAGSVFYGVVALIERAATFWHPSFRQS
jgi:NitT/TauT family transport system permease protein